MTDADVRGVDEKERWKVEVAECERERGRLGCLDEAG